VSRADRPQGNTLFADGAEDRADPVETRPSRATSPSWRRASARAGQARRACTEAGSPTASGITSGAGASPGGTVGADRRATTNPRIGVSEAGPPIAAGGLLVRMNSRRAPAEPGSGAARAAATIGTAGRGCRAPSGGR
jgi:hypothetical protein